MEFDDPRALYTRCEQCRAFLCHTDGGVETLSGAMCRGCVAMLDGKKWVYTSELMAFLDKGRT